MSAIDLITGLLIGIGALFFLAGTIGLLRFPDLHSRIHALTKADNLGLGFIVLGLLLQAESVSVAIKIVLIWLLALAAGATSGYLIGNHALESADDD
ncbi:MAG: monovalent cation/H(+) antiporter subunit G [Sphaerobacteraceae bacterium]|nr:MAG: monovalent cation/H(+) antiporter subunit G [Sphaerobacteraceae bacterium]